MGVGGRAGQICSGEDVVGGAGRERSPVCKFLGVGGTVPLVSREAECVGREEE